MYLLSLFKTIKNCHLKPKTKRNQQTREKESIDVVIDSAPTDNDTKSLSPQTPQPIASLGPEWEYHAEILECMRRSESKYMPKQDFMSTVQKDINWDMRRVLVDWLIEVQKEYGMDTHTLYLAVNYSDRILSMHSVHRSKLQLVGASCLMIASKYIEIHPPSLEEYVYICDDAYTAVQMRSMEAFVLNSLNFCVTVTTALDFLDLFLQEISASSKRKFFACYLAEIALGESIHTKYVPSKIAAAGVFLSGLHLSKEQWTESFDAICGYKYENIESVIQELHVIFVQRHPSPTNAVQVKYSAPEFLKVSEIKPRHTDLNQLIIHEKKRRESCESEDV